MPAVEAPLPAASAPCVKAPAAAFPAIRPAAGVRLPVFVLRVTTVLVRACASRGAVLGGAVVVQIFMQPRRYSVLHGGPHRVGRKPGAQAFAETGGAATILPRRLT